jgi:ATP-dependent DNA helicase RecG
VRLNLLLEGDVGCGKTIIAFLVMYFAVLNGKQAVLIAPTEILASQHYKNAQKFFADKGVQLAYLSSSVTKNDRANELNKIASGHAKCIFGTHSLLSDDVVFSNLSLVVIDEQHRFGVAQRARLENKTKGADCIVTSATPIPRTLALTLYGDLNRIVIDEMPARKAKTTTRFVPIEKENAMWEYVKNQADLDGRTFVVAPRISDEEDGVSAESIFEKRAKAFGDKIALLHGKIKDSEKNRIMQDFSDGKIKVLVATTVVEVGIDVPEATTMIVYGADRFGLSQLHQLRGRVGRGEKDAYCFVLSDTENIETKSRLDYFIKTNNGFELAEYDFKMRGAGDFLGYEQHGNTKGYSVDPVFITTCKNISDEMLANGECKKKIANSLIESTYDYFSEITLN